MDPPGSEKPILHTVETRVNDLRVRVAMLALIVQSMNTVPADAAKVIPAQIPDVLWCFDS